MTRKRKRAACRIHPEKVRYPSQRIAEIALDDLQHTDTYRGYAPQRAYECPYCNGWHLTARAVPARYTDEI